MSLRDRIQAVHDAEEQLNAFIKEQWPIGSSIVWRRDTHLYQGKVVRHSYDRRVYVKNDKTRKEYWIDCHFINDRTQP